jgi:hypothetical protein
VSGFNVSRACLKRKIEGSADGEGRRIDVAPRRESWPQQGPLNRSSSQRQNHLTEIIEFFCSNVSSGCSDETILPTDETIFRFRADIRKQPLVISYQRNGAQRLA